MKSLERHLDQPSNMKISLSIFLLLFVASSCNVKLKEQAEYLNYRLRLDSISVSNSSPQDTVKNVNLCSLFNINEWDSILIIRPYLPKKYLDAINFENSTEAKDSMEYVIGVEWAQGLLFFNKNELSNYCRFIKPAHRFARAFFENI